MEFDIRLGHTLQYLEGIININYINRLNPDVITWDTDTTKVHYIDFVLEQNPEETPQENPFGGIPNSNSSSFTSVIAAKVFEKVIFKESSVITCEPDKDPIRLIESNISKQVLHKLNELSLINKQTVNEYFPTGIDLELTGDKKIDKRKLISRILMASNLIATKGRRGPANFLFIGADFLDYLNTDISDDEVFIDIKQLNSLSLNGIKILVSKQIGDKVILGRCNKDQETGINIVTTDTDISGKVVKINPDDSQEVEITYQIFSLGEHPELNYVQFDIIKPT